jgi:hypothetical protein
MSQLQHMLGKNDLAFPEYQVKYPLFLLANPYLYTRKLLEITKHLAASTEHALEHYMVNLYPAADQEPGFSSEYNTLSASA